MYVWPTDGICGMKNLITFPSALSVCYMLAHHSSAHNSIFPYRWKYLHKIQPNNIHIQCSTLFADAFWWRFPPSNAIRPTTFVDVRILHLKNSEHWTTCWYTYNTYTQHVTFHNKIIIYWVYITHTHTAQSKKMSNFLIEFCIHACIFVFIAAYCSSHVHVASRNFSCIGFFVDSLFQYTFSYNIKG